MVVPIKAWPREAPVGEGPLTRLVTAMERAAWAGWPTTVRFIAQLATAAAAAALVIAVSR
jgi:hypothetical protein